MIRSVDRRLVRLAVIGAVAAVALAGCGRKGALDPPPSSTLSSNQPINQPPSQPPSLGEQPDPFGSAPSERPPQAAPPAAGGRPQPEKKTFILDPLLK